VVGVAAEAGGLESSCVVGHALWEVVEVVEALEQAERFGFICWNGSRNTNGTQLPDLICS
jgi:hypothetical protein